MVTQGDSLITIKIGDPAIDVNGSPHTLQATPFAEQGQAWVPVRFFNEAMGAQIGVDLSSNSVDISSPNVV